MRSATHDWKPEEELLLQRMKAAGSTDHQIAQVLGLTQEQVRWHRRSINETKTLVQESPYPLYDSPLVMEGNALVLPDIELPFHEADFLNRVLELSQKWGITKCIVAGDLLHFKSLSHWGETWEAPQAADRISEEHERKLLEFALKLEGKAQEELIAMLQEIGGEDNEVAGLSRELLAARRAVMDLSGIFDEIHYVLGNHDERFLRALESPMFPDELLNLIRAPEAKWKISPYYFSKLVSNNELFQIEHPRSSAKNTAIKLASIYHCHILMAHSHRWSMDHDPSGKYWAIQMGHIVDERRLPYASQRHSTSDAHALGAVIVLDGYPFLLSREMPFHLF